MKLSLPMANYIHRHLLMEYAFLMRIWRPQGSQRYLPTEICMLIAEMGNGKLVAKPDYDYESEDTDSELSRSYIMGSDSGAEERERYYGTQLY